jgi:hypothetical protein
MNNPNRKINVPEKTSAFLSLSVSIICSIPDPEKKQDRACAVLQSRTARSTGGQMVF